ncbi:phosphatase PAP2 family protein [Clostridium sp. ZS2-4]|uniref:phosphatase PAP2 family protein n=1 Tax=Clostridium sp. ZS2-4 TaxID=2987703 RepID=UPI00227CA4DF|nr:phosphatase PAP2 family protein [Clostridium sp. ZS2-4]MCY6355902.1 phosphatase PAP2 family protein [Clostridium sp. ZS2-4]
MTEFLTNDFNIEIIKAIQSFSNPTLDRIAQFITMMGEEAFFIVIIAIIFWDINKKFAYRVGFTLISSMVINGVIKESLKIPRVFGTEGIRVLRIKTATGYSFPSGHTQGTASFWISVMSNRKKKWTYILGITIIALVGFSRIYLGVHRPVDIIGGIVIAMIWVYISNKVFDFLEQGGKKSILLLLIIPMIIGLFVFKGHDYYVAVGTITGFLVGYTIESKYINFNEKASLVGNILKLALGITVVLLIKVVLKKILPQYLISDCIRYVFIAAWMTAGAPYLFKKIGIA